MRRTYRLDIEGKNRDRLIEASKHDIRKYIRRERRKELPAGADFWDFDVRFGLEEASAESIAPAELIRRVDAVVAEGGNQFFVQIERKPGNRPPRAAGQPAAEAEFDGLDD
jgi:hypothetical protein